MEKGEDKNIVAEKGQQLTEQQLAAYANQLEERLSQTIAKLREAKEQLQYFQMQDYYQRTQLLFAISSNELMPDSLRDRCTVELGKLLFPPVTEETPKE